MPASHRTRPENSYSITEQGKAHLAREPRHRRYDLEALSRIGRRMEEVRECLRRRRAISTPMHPTSCTAPATR